MGKTARFKSGVGFWLETPPPPLSTAEVLIDAVGYVCVESVKCDHRMRHTLGDEFSFSGRNFKPRLIDHSKYFCYSFSNFGQ